MAGDPHFSNVSLLLHMDGDNNSTAFIDSSPALKTVTRYGDVKISTAQSKFGGASMLVPAAVVGYLTTGPVIDLGSGSYTVEGFISLSNYFVTDYQAILSTNGKAYPNRWILDVGANASGLKLRVVTASNAIVFSSNYVAYTLGTFVHFAFVNNVATNTFTCFLNGVNVGSRGAVSLPYHADTRIGSPITSASDPAYYLDELRITVGVARYTADFTPPVTSFVDYQSQISGTVTGYWAANTFVASAYELATGLFAGSKTFTNTDYFTIDITIGAKACNVTVGVNYNIWKPAAVYGLDALVFPTDPIAKPYYYKRIASGTSGATEPVWPTTPGGVCNDGAVSNAWELVERLVQPITHGPLIPS